MYLLSVMLRNNPLTNMPAVIALPTTHVDDTSDPALGAENSNQEDTEEELRDELDRGIGPKSPDDRYHLPSHLQQLVQEEDQAARRAMGFGEPITFSQAPSFGQLVQQQAKQAQGSGQGQFQVTQFQVTHTKQEEEAMEQGEEPELESQSVKPEPPGTQIVGTAIEIANFQDAAREITNLRGEIAHTKYELDRAQETNHQLQLQLEGYLAREQVIKTQEEMYVATTAELHESKKKVNDLKAKLVNLQSKVARGDSSRETQLERKVESLEAEISHQSKTINNLRNDAARERSQTQAKQKELDSANKQVTQTLAQLGFLQDTIKKLEGERENLQSDVKALLDRKELYKEYCQEQANRIEKLTVSNADLEKEILVAQNSIKMLDGENVNLRKEQQAQIADLQKQLDEVHSKPHVPPGCAVVSSKVVQELHRAASQAAVGSDRAVTLLSQLVAQTSGHAAPLQPQVPVQADDVVINQPIPLQMVGQPADPTDEQPGGAGVIGEREEEQMEEEVAPEIPVGDQGAVGGVGDEQAGLAITEAADQPGQPEEPSGEQPPLDDLPLRCNICAELQSSIDVFTSHREQHQFKNLQCKSCCQQFTDATLCDQHTSGCGEQYASWVCHDHSTAFTRASSLREHFRFIHYKNDPEKLAYYGKTGGNCVYCAKYLSNNKVLTQHQKTCQENPECREYYCAFCRSTRRRESDMKAHYKKDHPGKRYKALQE